MEIGGTLSLSLVVKNLSILAVILAFASYSLGSSATSCFDSANATDLSSSTSLSSEMGNDSEPSVSHDPCHQSDASSRHHSDCSCSCHGGSVFISSRSDVYFPPLGGPLIDYSQLEYSVDLGPTNPPPKIA